MPLKDQIIAAYRQAIEPREIADRFMCPINYVTKVICLHKRETGEIVAPSSRRQRAPAVVEGKAWDLGPNGRRSAFYKRAVEGARKTRMAEA